MRPLRHALRSASGHDITVLGLVSLDLSIECLPAATFRFVVARGLPLDCILGNDFIKHFNVFLNPQTGHAFTNICPYLIGPESTMTARPLNAEVRHELTPGRSETRVSLNTSLPDGTYEVNVDNDLIPNLLGFVMPGLVKVMSQRVEVLVSNCTDVPLFLPRQLPIARLSQCPYDKGAVMAVSATSSPMEAVDFSHIPPDFREQFRGLLRSYAHLMNDDAADIGKCGLVKQRIVLKDGHNLACLPPRRIPPPLQPVVTEFVDKLLRAGIIQHSRSPYSSPLMLVKKAGGDPSKPVLEQYRVVHDYRALNKNVVKDSYPMQNIYALIDDVAASRIATVIDLRSAFFMQELEPESRKYTAFSVQGKGHFEYTRSPQGLVNSPNAFQRLLDKLFMDLPNVRVYIDDIVVFNNSWQDHLATLAAVFAKLAKHNFRCSVKKLQLACGSLNYLGYEIRPGVSVRPGEAKTAAIRAWPVPSDISQVKQFLGLCSFFRRTIPRFSELANPLTRLTRKDSAYKAGPLPSDAVAAFQALKDSLCSRPSLTPPDFSLPFVLTTDASTIALGAVLSQKHGDVECPIAYYSRTLQEAERKRAPFHLEHQAMVDAAKHFMPYLRGRRFTIRTDHKPLVALNKQKSDAFDRLQLQLREFDCDIEYMRGADMIADGLSRISPLPAASASTGTSAGVAAVAFPALSRDDLVRLQQSDTACKAIVVYLRQNSLPIDSELRRIALSAAKGASIRRNLLYFEDKIVAPFAIHHWLFSLSHDNALGGHWGPDKTYGKLCMQYWWPHMKHDITRMCAECVTCNSVNHRHDNSPPPLQQMPQVSRPYQIVNIDLLNLPTGRDGSQYILLMVDSFTRYAEAVPIPNKKAPTVAEALITGWVCRHGAPESFHSDLGKEFTNDILKSLCQKLRVSQTFTTPGHPQGNGKVERANKTLLNFLRKYLSANRDWVSVLPYAMFSINNSRHCSTGFSPHYLLFLNEPVLPFRVVDPEQPVYDTSPTGDIVRKMNSVYNEVLEQSELSFQTQKSDYDRRAKSSKFVLHDTVYLHTTADSEKLGKKLKKLFVGPFTIVDFPSPCHATIKKNNSCKMQRVHVSRLKLQPYTRCTLRDTHTHNEPVPDEETEHLLSLPSQPSPLPSAAPASPDVSFPTRDGSPDNKGVLTRARSCRLDSQERVAATPLPADARPVQPVHRRARTAANSSPVVTPPQQPPSPPPPLLPPPPDPPQPSRPGPSQASRRPRLRPQLADCPTAPVPLRSRATPRSGDSPLPRQGMLTRLQKKIQASSSVPLRRSSRLQEKSRLQVPS